MTLQVSFPTPEIAINSFSASSTDELFLAIHQDVSALIVLAFLFEQPQGFIRYAAGKPAGSSYRMNAANHYFLGCEKKHHPMKRIQASAIRWVKKFCLGRSRAKNISATMNNTMMAMAIRPATLRFFIILYLLCSTSGSLCTFSRFPL